MSRDVRPRPELAMQQQALVQLIVAGVLMATLCLGAALAYVYGFGHRSVRSVAPVLGTFMRAGADGNLTEGHRQMSLDGMADVSRDELAEIYGLRDLFDGFDHVQVDSFRIEPSDQPGDMETATVTATVYYDSRPPALLEATMDLEPSGWRIRSIRLSRGDK